MNIKFFYYLEWDIKKEGVNKFKITNITRQPSQES